MFFRVFTHIQMMPAMESGEEVLVGGQAVMEGVMMRAPHSYCVAVRKASGEIVTDAAPVARISEKHAIFKIPIFRGMGTLVQAMTLGLKALQFSANAALDDPACSPADQKPAAIPKWMMNAQLAFMLLFFIVLYKLTPLYLVTRLAHWYPVLNGRIAFNFADGLIRLGIFLAFLFLLSRLKEMRRLFEYHGAEHRVVFNYESGQPVTVPNAQRFTTFHPRCGTMFLLVVMIVSMVAYAFIPFDGFAAKFLSRLALLPVVIGVSYELIRFAAKRPGSMLAVLTTPGLWLQRITTKPPADDQAAVAISALEGAMALEQSQGGQLVIA